MSTQQTEQHPPGAETRAEPTTSVPALIQKARTQLTEYLKSGAHILCPLEVTDPPPGFVPRVMATHINADPAAKEVYEIEKGWEGTPNKPGRPAKLEFTKIGLYKICDMLGISWDDERSRRIDDGRNPVEVRYKAVGYRLDYQGRRQTIDGTFCVNLDAIRDEMVNNKTELAKAYMAKQGTAAFKEVPWKWRQAIENNQVAECIEKDVRAEMLKKRLKMNELAETGAKLRAIRSKGFRTTYTAQELEKDFVDVAMVPIAGPETLNQAGRAFQQLFGAPQQSERTEQAEPAQQRPEDVIIDAKANQAADPPKSQPMSKEHILADFDCSDQDQAVEIAMTLSERKAFPLAEAKIRAMKETDLRNLVSLMLDMPDQKGGGL